MFIKKSALVLALALCATSFADEYIAVPPKVDGCYQISTGQEMNGFIGIVNGTYVKEYSPDGTFWDDDDARYDYLKDPAACGVLTADIELVADENGWVPLKNFSGSFDGQGHTIANLGVGGGRWFFESIVGGTEDNPVTVKNVGWVNASISFDSRNFIGLIYSVNGYIHLDHLFNDVDFSVKEGNVAAFVLGQRGHLTISNSYNTGKIMNGYYDKETSGIFVGNAGGVVHLENVYNRGGNVSLIGYAHDTVTIVNGYTVGEGKSDPVVDRTEYQGSYAVVRQSNFYYPNTVVSYGVPVEDFVDGSIALKLHYMNDDGEIWGQNADVDSFPDFSGKITGDHSSTVKVSNITVVSFEGDTSTYPKHYIEGRERPFEYVPPARDGFVFSGWFYNPDGAGEPITKINSSETGDKTIYGKWWAVAERTGDCYEIGSMEDLFGFAAVVNGAPGVEKDSLACGKLVADIKYPTHDEYFADGLWWLPIQDFAGNFDGNGFTISGLYSRNAEYYEDLSEPVGLFGSINGGSDEKPVVIKNLKLKDCYFSAEWRGGAVVGHIKKDSRVLLDSIEVDMTMGGQYRIGGIVGVVGGFAELTLKNSGKKGLVDAGYNVGGLVGDVWGDARVTIFNSFVDGGVSAYNSAVGSVVGYVNTGADVLVRQVYAKGDVYGFSYMGGLVGNNNGFLRIENTYHVGDVTTRSSCPDGGGAFRGAVIGGFVGVSTGVLSLVNSYQLGTLYNRCKVKTTGEIAGFMHPEDVRTDNVFYPSTLIADSTVDGVDGEMFTNGFVANALHHYDNGEINGAIWGQEVGVDQYPVFTSEIKGYEGEHKFSKLVLYTYESDPFKYANTYEEGVETQLPIPYREGHIFHGWYENPDFTGDSIGKISATATGELHYYANLEIKRFYWDAAVIVDLDSCGGSVEGVGYYDYGSTVTLTAVPDPGCKLDDRYTTFKDGIEVRENITSDGAVRAYFTCEKYDIIYHLDKGSFPYWYDKQYSHGRATELVTPNHPRCYTFAGWYDNEGLEGEPIDSIPKGSIGVKEFWSKWTLDDTESCQEISSSSVASSSSEQQSSSSVSSSSSSVQSSSSSTVVSSSSSAKSSSSSATSSSSMPEFSSSSAPESSSGAKSSSSSAKSSSSDAPKSSSSKTNFIAPVWDANMVVSTAGRNIHIDGARVGMPLALFDMQGRVIHVGRTAAPSVDLYVPNPGSYLVKIGSNMKLVRIK